MIGTAPVLGVDEVRGQGGSQHTHGQQLAILDVGCPLAGTRDSTGRRRSSNSGR